MTMSPPSIRAEMSGITEAPGKVWFWELAAAVIDADRCVQCGACVAACPTDSIGIGTDDLPRPRSCPCHTRRRRKYRSRAWLPASRCRRRSTIGGSPAQIRLQASGA
jgi:ferredoxin